MMCWLRRKTGGGPPTGPGALDRVWPPGSPPATGIAGPHGNVSSLVMAGRGPCRQWGQEVGAMGTTGSPDRRDESEAERVDRNLAELLQELRVAGLGVQVLFGFLLSLPFTNRFS